MASSWFLFTQTFGRFFFLFCWPRISIYLWNKNQVDALFIVSLFRPSKSTYFAHVCNPSVDRFGMELFHPNPANRHSTKKHNTYQLLYIYSIPACRVLRLRIEERPQVRRVAANKLNKQSRTADKRWSSSLGVGRGANNHSL